MKTADNEESRLESIRGKVRKWKEEGYKVDELEDSIENVVKTIQTRSFTPQRSKYIFGVVAVFVTVAVVTSVIMGSPDLDMINPFSVDDAGDDLVITGDGGSIIMGEIIPSGTPDSEEDIPEPMPISPLNTMLPDSPFYNIQPPEYAEYDQEASPYDPAYAVLDPPESIPWSPPFIRLPPIIIYDSIQDTSFE